MTLLESFYWLQYSGALVDMRASPWLFPAIAVLHLLGLAMLGGTVLVVDLRLLGLGLSRHPVAELARATEPWLIGSLALLFATGIPLFLCFATKYYYLTAFWVKLTALALVVAFTFSIKRRMTMRPGSPTRSAAGKLVALLSLALWISIALGGRVIGFP